MQKLKRIHKTLSTKKELSEGRKSERLVRSSAFALTKLYEPARSPVAIGLNCRTQGDCDHFLDQ